MAVLVTGAGGHVGSWITAELAHAGEKVLAIDVAHPMLDYLETVKDRIVFLKASILDFPSLVDIARTHTHELRAIVHAAAVSDFQAFQDNPYPNVTLNLMGTLNVLELARLFDIPRVVYTSSGAVYGSAPGVLDELTTPARPSDLYGATKVSSELVGLQYANLFGLDLRSVRLFFVYGPGKLPSRHNPLYRAVFGPLEGLTHISINRGLDQCVDWTYVRDAAYGTILALRAENPTHKVFNISSGVAYSVPEMLEVVRRFSPVQTEVHVGPGLLLERGGPMNIERARKDLGFAPRYDLVRGVKEYADWLARNVRPASG